MATKPKLKKVDVATQDFHNESRKKLELLLEELSEERRKGIKREFDQMAAYPAIDILKGIVDSDGLDTEEKLSALRLVHDAAAKMAMALEAPSLFQPEGIQLRERWKDRDKKKKEKAIDFIRRVYKAEIEQGTLTMPMLRKDIELYQAYNGHIRNYPEDNLNLKSKSEVVDEQIAVLDSDLSKRVQSLTSTLRKRQQQKKP